MEMFEIARIFLFDVFLFHSSSSFLSSNTRNLFVIHSILSLGRNDRRKKEEEEEERERERERESDAQAHAHLHAATCLDFRRDVFLLFYWFLFVSSFFRVPPPPPPAAVSDDVEVLRLRLREREREREERERERERENMSGVFRASVTGGVLPHSRSSGRACCSSSSSSSSYTTGACASRGEAQPTASGASFEGRRFSRLARERSKLLWSRLDSGTGSRRQSVVRRARNKVKSQDGVIVTRKKNQQNSKSSPGLIEVSQPELVWCWRNSKLELN